jgi:hypothetical protein
MIDHDIIANPPVMSVGKIPGKSHSFGHGIMKDFKELLLACMHPVLEHSSFSLGVRIRLLEQNLGLIISLLEQNLGLVKSMTA